MQVLSLPNLDLVQDGIPIVRMTFSISLYTGRPLSSFATELIAVFEQFCKLVGDQNLHFYSTDTMRKHKPVTARVFGLLKDWFGKTAPPNENYGLELTDAEPFNAAPRTRFEITGTEDVNGRLESASLVRLVFPPEWGLERSEEVLDLVRELCTRIPFRSGQAGFAFDCSRYFPDAAFDHAWAQSMRHPGVDINSRAALDSNAVRYDGVRGVGWLTMLDQSFVEQLGGPPELKGCETIPVKGGVIIRAGDRPAIGDVNRQDNLPAYREVFRWIRPLTTETFDRSPWLPLSDNSTADERTRRWYERFAHG